MNDKKYNFHYFFGFKHIPMVVFEHYDFFKKIVEYGPASVRKFLTDQWEKQAELFKEEYENLQLLNNLDQDHPFEFSMAKREGKSDLFSIYMPPMAPPTDTAITCVIITVAMNNDVPEIYTCEFDDYTIQKMKAMGASTEHTKPHFIVEKITPEKEFVLINDNCPSFSEYFAVIG